MKRIFSLLLVAGFATFVACGPSAEEKQAAEKARQDSIDAAVAKMQADSIAMAEMEKARVDSMNAVMEKMKADSIATAQAAKKKATHAKPAPTQTPTPKAGKKRPGEK